MTAIDGLPVLELADELGVDHTCPLCSDLDFDGFESGLSEADLAALRACHDEVVSIEAHLRDLATRRDRLHSVTGDRFELRMPTGVTYREHRLAVLARSVQAAASARERTVETMRWIIAGRPTRASGVDLLWPERPKI